jgi:hypothetical protein
MCAGCHRWWHEYPLLSGPWFKKNWPERSERIIAIFNAGGKVDLEQLFEELSLPAHRPVASQIIRDNQIPF